MSQENPKKPHKINEPDQSASQVVFRSENLAKGWQSRIPENNQRAKKEYEQQKQIWNTPFKDLNDPDRKTNQTLVQYWDERVKEVQPQSFAAQFKEYSSGNRTHYKGTKDNTDQSHFAAWHQNVNEGQGYQHDYVGAGQIDEPGSIPDLQTLAFDLHYSFGLTFVGLESKGGSTASISLQYNEQVVTANLGDSSTGVLVKSDESSPYEYHPLTWAQAADSIYEQQRIGVGQEPGKICYRKAVSTGAAQTTTVTYGVGAPKLNGATTNKALSEPTRAWGDVAVTGTTLTPEISTFTLQANSTYQLIAHSDGMVAPIPTLEKVLNERKSDVKDLPKWACELSLDKLSKETKALSTVNLKEKEDEEQKPHLYTAQDNVSCAVMMLKPNSDALRFAFVFDGHNGTSKNSTIAELGKLLLPIRLKNFLKIQTNVLSWLKTESTEPADKIIEMLANPETDYWKNEVDAFKGKYPGMSQFQNFTTIAQAVYLQYIYKQIQLRQNQLGENEQLKAQALLDFIETFLLNQAVEIKKSKKSYARETSEHIKAIVTSLCPIEQNFQGELANFVVDMIFNKEKAIPDTFASKVRMPLCLAYANYYKAYSQLRSQTENKTDLKSNAALSVMSAAHNIALKLNDYGYFHKKTAKQLTTLTNILTETNDVLNGKPLSKTYFKNWKSLSIPWNHKQKLGAAIAAFGIIAALGTGLVVASIFCPAIPVIGAVVAGLSMKTVIGASVGGAFTAGASFFYGRHLVKNGNPDSNLVRDTTKQFEMTSMSS